VHQNVAEMKTALTAEAANSEEVTKACSQESLHQLS